MKILKVVSNKKLLSSKSYTYSSPLFNFEFFISEFHDLPFFPLDRRIFTHYQRLIDGNPYDENTH